MINELIAKYHDEKGLVLDQYEIDNNLPFDDEFTDDDNDSTYDQIE